MKRILMVLLSLLPIMTFAQSSNIDSAKKSIRSVLYEKEKPRPISPDWKKIKKDIKHEYPGLTDLDWIILEAKANFYLESKNWGKYAEAKTAQIERELKSVEKPDLFNLLNIPAWTIFLKSNDPYALQKALEWSELSIKLAPVAESIQFWDTKANLLYKLGHKDKAIATEEIAIKTAVDHAPKDDTGNPFFVKEYREIIDKMKKGEATWTRDKK